MVSSRGDKGFVHRKWPLVIVVINLVGSDLEEKDLISDLASLKGSKHSAKQKKTYQHTTARNESEKLQIAKYGKNCCKKGVFPRNLFCFCFPKLVATTELSLTRSLACQHHTNFECVDVEFERRRLCHKKNLRKGGEVKKGASGVALIYERNVCAARPKKHLFGCSLSFSLK